MTCKTFNFEMKHHEIRSAEGDQLPLPTACTSRESHTPQKRASAYAHCSLHDWILWMHRYRSFPKQAQNRYFQQRGKQVGVHQGEGHTRTPKSDNSRAPVHQHLTAHDPLQFYPRPRIKQGNRTKPVGSKYTLPGTAATDNHDLHLELGQSSRELAYFNCS